METTVMLTDRPERLKEAVNAAVGILEKGGVVAVPTETVYGLAADALNATAVAGIFAAKDRPEWDPLIVHLPHRDWLEQVAAVPEDIAKTVAQLTTNFWPGPLTILLPRKAMIPDIVTAGLPMVAVRISADPVFRRIITSLARPLAAPSANRFGRISPTSAAAVLQELSGRVPLIVDGGACHQGLESTIVQIIPAPGKSKPVIKILRAGPITKDDLVPYGKIVWANELPEAGSGTPVQVPGQVRSHYAPRTPLTIVEEPESWQPVEGRRYALLSYRGDPDDGYLELAGWKEVAVLSPGSGKLPEAAVRFFHCLRQLDELGVDEIIAEPLPDRGLGVAMLERLRRAAHS